MVRGGPPHREVIELKVVLLGGTGFIGSHVAEQCQLAGLALTCLVRASSDTQFLRSLPVAITVSDFSDAALQASFRGADAVVNCLARPQLHIGLQERRAVDVELTRRALCQAQRSGVRRFVQLSTVQVYGFQRPARPIDETYPMHADYPLNRVAIEREQVLMAQARDSATELVILRPVNTIGARDPNFKRIAQAQQSGFFPIFRRNTRFSCIDARDVGRAMGFLAQRPRLQHNLYLLSGYDTTWESVKSRLDALRGRRSRLLLLPARAMLPIGWVCEALFPFGSEPPLTPFAVRVLSTDTLFDSRRIAAEGFEPRYRLEDTLRAYVRSLQARHWPKQRSPAGIEK